MRIKVSEDIKLKRMLFSSVAIILLSLALGIASYQSSSKALYDHICESYISRATDNSKYVRQVFESKLTELEIIASNPQMKTMDWQIQKSYLLSQKLRLNTERYQVIDLAGNLRSTGGENISIKVNDREYFRTAVEGNAIMSDVLISRVDQRLSIICASPIRDDNGNVVGVLSEPINYQILKGIIDNIQIGQGGFAFMINKEGFFVAHPEVEKVLSRKVNLESMKADQSQHEYVALLKKMVQYETGYGFYEANGTKMFMSYTPVGGTDWFLALTIPKDTIFSSVESLRNKFILLTSIFAVIAFILSILIMSYMAQSEKMRDLKRNVDDNYKQLMEITELDRIRVEFFSNISHEFRTPLNVLLGTLQLFEYYISSKKEQSIEDTKKRIRIMKQNCLRLLRLVNNLIDSTKIDSNYLDLHLEKNNIISVIEEITLSVAGYMKEKGIELTFDTDVEEKEIAFDHDKIERILLNLLSNAMKFTPQGGKVEVIVSDLESRVQILVRDTGIGIPKEKSQVVFERFRQVDKSLTRNHEGSGIGLSLTKSLVQMHQGSICVNEHYVNGCEIAVTLPATLQPAEDQLQNPTQKHNSRKPDYIERIEIEFSDIYM